MADLADGTYWVHNAWNGGTLVMDVVHGDRKDGANVRVWHHDSTDNQVFEVSTRSDGSRQVTSRFTGKSIDVENGTWQNGTNVRMWTDNDSRAQSWDIVDTGETISYLGTNYPLYQIVQRQGEGWCVELMGVSGFDDGTNVCISKGAATDQKWFFRPIPDMRDGGVYELALRLDTRYALDVHSGSKANGTNVILTGRHGANDHKWLLTEHAANKWLLMNMASGKHAEVKNGQAANLTNVQQWEFVQSSPNRWLWKPVSFGTMVVDGITCPIVKLYSWVDGDGSTYVMDANQHARLDLGNICIVQTDPDDQGQMSQEWALVPTTATDPNMAIPDRMGWSPSVGDRSRDPVRAAAERLYPTWECTSAWATSGPNHYEWRIRSRSMSASTSTWDAWGSWGAWSTALVTHDGMRCWVTEGLPAELDESQKAMQYEMQVRTVGVGETARVVGMPASQILTAAWEPDVTISNAGFSPDGVRFDYESDYESGTNVITVTSVRRSSGEQILSSPVRVDNLDAASSVLVPLSSLNGWVSDGEQLTISWHNGTDQFPEFGTDHSHQMSVAYDAGHGTTMTPTVSVGSGRTLRVSIPSGLDSGTAWLRTEGGALVEIEERDGVCSVEYPFGVAFDVFVTAISSDNDTWFTWHKSYDAGSVEDARPCHAFNWDGGSFLLELELNNAQTANYSVESVHEVLTLSARKWQVAHASGSFEGTFTATGALRWGLSESTKDDLVKMAEVGHVRYRSPFGDIADVYVSSYSWEESSVCAKVTVKMVRESL